MITRCLLRCTAANYCCTASLHHNLPSKNSDPPHTRWADYQPVSHVIAAVDIQLLARDVVCVRCQEARGLRYFLR